MYFIHNEINNSKFDILEKSFLCFENNKNIYDKYEEYLYNKLANFLFSLTNNIETHFNMLDEVYKNKIELIEKKLYFSGYNVNKIAVLLFEKFYNKNKDKAFDNYINFIENYIYENHEWYYLDFSIYYSEEKTNIKNCFFNSAIKFLENVSITLKDYHSVLEEKDMCKFDENILKQTDLDMFYYFLKKSKFSEYFVNRFYNDKQIDKIFNLLKTIIKFYDYNTYYINYEKENPIFKLLKLNNEFINAVLFLSKDKKLNIFYLKHFEYFHIGFINLVEILVDHQSDLNTKVLTDELIKIFFQHFYRLDKKNEFYKKFFFTLNIIIDKYYKFHISKSQHHIFYYQYLLNKFFYYLKTIEIEIEKYKKIFLFDFIFDELIKLQMEINNIYSYFLLNQYFKLATNFDISINNNLKEKIIDNIKILLGQYELFVDFNFIEKIDFSTFYDEKYKNIWLNIIDIQFKKENWEKIIKERYKKQIITSKDKREPKAQIKLYFKILTDIFEKNRDLEIEEKIIELAKIFGLDVEFGIFEDSFWNKDYFYEKFLKILNLFDEKSFETFLINLEMKNEIHKIVKLYNYTYSTKRKNKILNSIKKLLMLPINSNIKHFNYNARNIIETIEILLNNELFDIADKILNIIRIENEELNYLKCKKQVLETYLFHKNFDKLNEIKYIKDDRNKGIESFYNKCEKYKTLIRALIFFDKEPEKTANILSSEINSTIFYKKLFFVNLINAHLKLFIQNKNKFYETKLSNSIKTYEKYLREQNLNKDIFDYKTLLFSYIELDDYINANLIIGNLPEYYLTDFEIINLKYHFLKKFSSEIKAVEFVDIYKKYMTEEEIKIIEKEKLKALFEYRKKVREKLSKTLKFQFAISFAGKYREHMSILFKELRKLGYEIFFDDIYTSQMLGENLIEYLTNIFKKESEYVVIFVSKEYKEKFYTNEVEKKAILNKEYFQDCIIQIKFDDTNLEEIPSDNFYIDLRNKNIEKVDWKSIAIKLDKKYKGEIDV
jgi:hypothetical protein